MSAGFGGLYIVIYTLLYIHVGALACVAFAKRTETFLLQPHIDALYVKVWKKDVRSGFGSFVVGWWDDVPLRGKRDYM